MLVHFGIFRDTGSKIFVWDNAVKCALDIFAADESILMTLIEDVVLLDTSW